MFVAVKSPIVPAPNVAPPQPPFVDNPFAPEIFATGYAGLANLNGVIVLTLESARCDHSKPQPALERVVVLNQFLEQQGLSPSRMLADGATFQ